MKLNHIDLQVSNVPQTAEFFERHFDFEICGNRTSPAIIVLADREGSTLVLQRLRNESEKFPTGFHIGFIVDELAIVHEKRARMIEAEIHTTEIIENNRGTMFYCTAPGDITVEVNCTKIQWGSKPA